MKILIPLKKGKKDIDTRPHPYFQMKQFPLYVLNMLSIIADIYAYVWFDGSHRMDY